MSALADEQTEGTSSFEDVAKLVKDLKDSVVEMKKGQVDEATVRTMVQQAVTASRQAGSPHPEGFVPEDVEGTDVDSIPAPGRGKWQKATPQQRMDLILQTPARQLAPMMRRPVEAVKAFQQASDTLILLSAMTKKHPTELDFFHDVYLPTQQASMDTKTAGEGKELVAEAAISTDLIEKLEGDLVVLSMFQSITMPTNPFKFPVKGPRKHVAILAEALDPGTPKAKLLIPGVPTELEMTATKFAGEIITSKELEEDAAIAILPFLEDELREWLAYDLEDAAMNGSIAAMDSGVPADDVRKAWNGLRASTPATAKVDAGGDALTVDDLAAVRAKMGRYGLRPTDVTVILPVPCLYDLIVDEKVQTPDKYGSGATLISGELGRIWGMPILVSDTIPLTMDATGVVPAVAGNLTSALIVWSRAFLRGIRRNTTVQVLTELYAESDQDAVLLTTRQAFTNRYPGEPVVAQAINVATV